MFDEHLFAYEVKVEDNNNQVFVYHHVFPSFVSDNFGISLNACKYVVEVAFSFIYFVALHDLQIKILSIFTNVGNYVIIRCILSFKYIL